MVVTGDFSFFVWKTFYKMPRNIYFIFSISSDVFPVVLATHQNRILNSFMTEVPII